MLKVLFPRAKAARMVSRRESDYPKQRAIKAMKSGKAPWPNVLPVEVIKIVYEEMPEHLFKMMNSVTEERKRSFADELIQTFV